MVTKTTDQDFENLLQSNENIIVKFYADWCGSCRLFAPKFNKLSNKAEFEKAVRLWTAASRAYASQVRQVEGAIKRLESARLIAINKPIELAASIADARESAKLICTKGF